MTPPPAHAAHALSLAQLIADHARLRPQATAFITGERHLSWSDYHGSSDRLAQLLVDAGFEPGERIGVLLPDSDRVHVAFIACEKAGLIAVGIAPRAAEREIAHVLGVAGASALISPPEHQGMAAAELFARLRSQQSTLRAHLLWPENSLSTIVFDGASIALAEIRVDNAALDARRLTIDQPFLINSTSGTTGMPKCILHQQRRWLRFADYALDSAPLDARDIFLCAVPASVGFGLWFGHFLPALLGAATIVLPKFSVAGLVDAIVRHRAGVVAAVSTQLIMLLNHLEEQPVELSGLKVLYTGGEAVPFERAARFEALTGATVLQFYGSNEAGALSYTSTRDSREKRLRSAGRVIPEMNVTLLDTDSDTPTALDRGRPACRGPLNSLGYYNDDEANRRLYTDDGFMKMEDIVRIDGEGYLSVIGRVGDFIIRGGKNISAAAVEEAALAHRAVSMAAAVAMPDPVFGEKVCLYVTLADGAALTLAELCDFLRTAGVSKENFPERLVILDEMPMVSGGKIAKRRLRDDIRRRLAQQAEPAPENR